MSKLWQAYRSAPLATTRTLIWSARAIHLARKSTILIEQAPRVPSAPRVSPAAEPAIHAMLRLTRQPCYVIATVRQEWMHAQGQDLAVIVGVRRGEGSVEAHAWLEGDPPGAYRGYREIARRGYAQGFGPRRTPGAPHEADR